MSETHDPVSSPDGCHCAQLIFEGEVFEGPSYYKVVLDGRVLDQRVFGGSLVWSADSRYLALEEWLSTDRRRGPSTVLFVVDVEGGCYYNRSKSSNGFIYPRRFEGSTLIFMRNRGIMHQEFELDIGRVTEWQPLEFADSASSRPVE